MSGWTPPNIDLILVYIYWLLCSDDSGDLCFLKILTPKVLTYLSGFPCLF